MEQLRKSLTIELAMCETKRDITRVFDAVQSDIRTRSIPKSEQLLVLKEIEKKLPMLLAHDKHGQLIEEARGHIYQMIDKAR